jgi:hypothetical protein
MCSCVRPVAGIWPQVVTLGSGTIPFNHLLANEWDYQGLFTDGNGNFLAAWSGDTRYVAEGGSPGIWSAQITP